MTKQPPQHGEWDGEAPVYARVNKAGLLHASILAEDFIKYREFSDEGEALLVCQAHVQLTSKIQEVVTRWQRMDGPTGAEAMSEIRAILEGR